MLDRSEITDGMIDAFYTALSEQPVGEHDVQVIKIGLRSFCHAMIGDAMAGDEDQVKVSIRASLGDFAPSPWRVMALRYDAQRMQLRAYTQLITESAVKPEHMVLLDQVLLLCNADGASVETIRDQLQGWIANPATLTETINATRMESK